MCSQGLKHIHDQNILHLDLKPANIFLTKRHYLKIGDFGISGIISEVSAHCYLFVYLFLKKKIRVPKHSAHFVIKTNKPSHTRTHKHKNYKHVNRTTVTAAVAVAAAAAAALATNITTPSTPRQPLPAARPGENENENENAAGSVRCVTRPPRTWRRAIPSIWPWSCLRRSEQDA